MSPTEPQRPRNASSTLFSVSSGCLSACGWRTDDAAIDVTPSSGNNYVRHLAGGSRCNGVGVDVDPAETAHLLGYIERGVGWADR